MRWLVLETPASRVGACVLAAFGGLFATMTGPSIRATLSNVTTTDQRGVAFASFALFDDVGKGAGPAVVALLVRTMGRRHAFACAMLGWLPCALLCGCTGLTVVGDEVRATKRDREAGRLEEPERRPLLPAAHKGLEPANGCAKFV